MLVPALIDADSKGGSKSGVTVTFVKVSGRRVRVTSDYDRLGTAEVDLTEAGHSIFSGHGDVVLWIWARTHPNSTTIRAAWPVRGRSSRRKESVDRTNALRYKCLPEWFGNFLRKGGCTCAR